MCINHYTRSTTNLKEILKRKIIKCFTFYTIEFSSHFSVRILHGPSIKSSANLTSSFCIRGSCIDKGHAGILKDGYHFGSIWKDQLSPCVKRPSCSWSKIKLVEDSLACAITCSCTRSQLSPLVFIQNANIPTK